MQQVLRFLNMARAHRFDGQIEVLTQCLLPGMNLDTIYIRGVYHKLYRLIHDDPGSRIVTIEGIPGIGATSMAPYYIWRLLHESKRRPKHIFFCPFKVKAHIFQIDCDSGKVSTVEEYECEVALSDYDYLLIDGKVPEFAGRLSKVMKTFCGAKAVARGNQTG